MDTNELKSLAEAAGLVDWKWWTSNSFLRLTTESKGRHGAGGDAISAYRDSIQCPEAYRAFIEKASPAAIGELITRNKELADEVIVVEFQKKILGEGLRKDRAEIDQLKAENEALRKLAPSKEIAWCACGDGRAANSYGAGFMDANNGVCQNCDASMSKAEQ